MQISSEVIKVLEYLGDKFGLVIGWSSENILPYVSQLCEKFIVWETNTSIAWIVIMGICVVLALALAITIECLTYDADFIWTVFVFVLAISVSVIGFQIFDIIECKTFPEKALFDYIQNYIAMR